MFKRILMLAMAVFMFTGCAATTQKNVSFAEGQTTFYEEFQKVKLPFIIVYGENGQELVFTREASCEQEEYCNLVITLLEPGFIVYMSKSAKDAGLPNQLESLFEQEGYQVVGSKEIGRIWQMNFAKRGEIVFFK